MESAIFANSQKKALKLRTETPAFLDEKKSEITVSDLAASTTAAEELKAARPLRC
jgi:hypothetical protein